MLAASFAAVAQNGNSAIFDTEWQLIEANGVKYADSGAMFTIDSDGKLSGSTGCNRMMGTAAVNGSRIKFSPIGTTKMMCKLPAGSIPENTFLSTLGKAAKFSVADGKLTFRDRRSRKLMVFRSTAAVSHMVETTLDGPKWVLDSFAKADAKTSTDAAALDRKSMDQAFLIFDEKQCYVSGRNGCNGIGAEYQRKGSSLKFGSLIQTMMACQEPLNTIERRFTDVVRSATHFEIVGPNLKLFSGRQLLATFRAEPRSSR